MCHLHFVSFVINALPILSALFPFSIPICFSPPGCNFTSFFPSQLCPPPSHLSIISKCKLCPPPTRNGQRQSVGLGTPTKGAGEKPLSFCQGLLFSLLGSVVECAQREGEDNGGTMAEDSRRRAAPGAKEKHRPGGAKSDHLKEAKPPTGHLRDEAATIIRVDPATE
ncbi:hypothetical protein niasHT_020548 [Heterodera trifolii]|uniref:Uncharacterized protein n=1 Tax=Heterodera trifolii TaxID=157864 RepID=A0ABD2J9I9_9BILA